MGRKYLRHLANLRFAIAGILRAIRGEKTFHMILVGSIVLGGISIGVGVPLWRLGMIGFAFSLILGCELLNSALERLADRVEPKKDSLIEMSKDFAAGAILIIGIGAVLLWVALTFF